MTLYDQKQLNKILAEKFGIKNIMRVPRLVSVSVNAGIGRLAGDKGLIEKVAKDLSKITGQKAIVTKSRKSISAFKLRENMPVGVAATLRGKKAEDLVIKIINITLPRLRDFSGIKRTSLDGHGNLSIGFKEQVFFPEIRFEEVDKSFGLQVNIKTSAKNDEEAIGFFEALGLPFKKEVKNG